MSVDELLHWIDTRKQLASRLVHRQELPARPARFAAADFPLQPGVRRMLAGQGIERLYRHQAEAIEAARAGRHVVVTTGTASGKTLCYLVPVLESLIADPAARSLLFFPTKALAQDQLRALAALAGGEPGFALRAGVYDGDTPAASRARIRRESGVILSNPDMLHAGILPNHSLRHWQFFFENLRLVVVDEIHTYRGIFGSHVANVIRRLRRVCAYYGSAPLFICCSATIGNPRELAERLIGAPVQAVTEDGSPRSPKTFLFWNPPPFGPLGRRPGVVSEARRLLPRAVTAEVRTILFTRARMTAEVVAEQTRRLLGEAETGGGAREERETGGIRRRGSEEAGGGGGPWQDRIQREAPARQGMGQGAGWDGGPAASQPRQEVGVGVPSSPASGRRLAARVTSYRSGYLPEERRAIERDLAAGRTLCVVSTSALELGVDISGLDLCVLGGYPGSVAATWQRAGRAGRRDGRSLVVLIAGDNPLDQFLMKHPGFFFGAPVERAVIDPDNRLVLSAHLRAAAAELPLSPADVALFPALDEMLPELIDGGELRQGRSGLSWQGEEHPAGRVSLRSSSQATYTIQEEGSGREVGTVEDTAAFLLVHPHAVYLHLGETYLVTRLDVERRMAIVQRQRLGHHTRPVVESRLRVLREAESRELAGSGAAARFGELRVTTRVTHFRKLREGTLENLGSEPLDLRESTLETQGVWVVLPGRSLEDLQRRMVPLPHVAEGLSYLLENTLPLFALCEPRDVRAGTLEALIPGKLSEEGVSLPQVRPAVVVYDLYPGGIGYARRGYAVLERWLAAAREIAGDCPCRHGCPACVGGEMADKAGVILALDHLLRGGRDRGE